MPELARFYGIIIRMYAADHPTPHFHAQYAEWKAVIGIADLSVIEGSLPSRAAILACTFGDVTTPSFIILPPN